MPLVKIQYDENHAETAKLLSSRLAYVVAEALSCDHPDGKLLMEDIDIELGLIPPPRYSPQKHDIRITIDANEYPERLANLDQRRQQIVNFVKHYLADEGKHARGFVWVRLFPASFGGF